MSSSDVSLTSSMRSNLLLLQKTNRQVESIQTKLATGNKVNSALDGPNSFFAAKSLSTRSSDLSSLKESMGQAISTIQAGDKGITAIESLVEQARGLTTTAYSNLGTDAASVATRKSLADQFNRIKEQIDKIAQDSGYAGKNLLTGSGLSLDSTSESRTAVNSVTGLSNSRVTNVVRADTYSVNVSGTGAITANLGDIAKAEDARGITSLKVSGTISSTAGNFADISIEMRGNTGRERTVVVTENGESRTIKFFDNTQNAVASTTTAGVSGTSQQSKVTISGAVEVGDTFTATVNGTAYTYTVTQDDLDAFNSGAGTGDNPADRRKVVAEGLYNAMVADTTNFNDSGTALANGDDTGARFNVAYNDGEELFIGSDSTAGTGVSFTVGASASNAAEKAVSITFSSGTTVSFTIDRTSLEALNTSANGTSTIEKNVDITLSATNLNGVTVERSGTNARGNAKLSDGENSLNFDSGTVRVTVDAKTIKGAASAQSSANLTTVQRTDANTENDLSVQFNSDNTSNIQVVSRNVQTDGQGLRVDYAQNGFLDRSDIDNAVASLDYAKATLRSASQSLSTNLNVIQTRENFTSEFSNVLTEGANKLTQADQNEEGANLLLLQTRQQLGTISLSLANQAQQSILRLF
ncbi:flagellin [Niveispirillum fermenti]|uniref:flagellin N-terminal helical domain-containing protein n=1 Tax=Niveispirillum fermenti TaxID=1233113 RepID=UPI003A84151B